MNRIVGCKPTAPAATEYQPIVAQEFKGLADGRATCTKRRADFRLARERATRGDVATGKLGSKPFDHIEISHQLVFYLYIHKHASRREISSEAR